MKKYRVYAFLVLGSLSALTARENDSIAASNLITFMNMAEEHKLDWISYMQEQALTKADLLKRITEDWFIFKKAQVNLLDKLTDFDEQAKQDYFDYSLAAALALHKKHMALWEEWAEKYQAIAQELCQGQKDELANFENNQV